jgi:hypothetical protein
MIKLSTGIVHNCFVKNTRFSTELTLCSESSVIYFRKMLSVLWPVTFIIEKLRVPALKVFVAKNSGTGRMVINPDLQGIWEIAFQVW